MTIRWLVIAGLLLISGSLVPVLLDPPESTALQVIAIVAALLAGVRGLGRLALVPWESALLLVLVAAAVIVGLIVPPYLQFPAQFLVIITGLISHRLIAKRVAHQAPNRSET